MFEPWYKDAFEQLEKRVLRLKLPRERLRAILLGLWRDIPIANIGLANSLMEALASADPKQKKPIPAADMDRRAAIEAAGEPCPRPKTASGGSTRTRSSTLFIMAYDGFVINRRLNDLRDIERLSDAMCDILLGPAAR